MFPFLPCLLFLFFPQLFVKPPQTTLCLLTFLFLWDGFGHSLLYSVKTLSIIFQALSLSDLITCIYLSVHCILIGIWFRSYLNNLMAFLNFFSLSLKFAMRSWWSESQSVLGLIFTDCIELLHLWLQRT